MDLPDWFPTLLLQLLAKPNWAELRAEGVHHAGWLVYRKMSQDASLVGTTIPAPYFSLLGFLNLPWHESTVERSFGKGKLRLLMEGHEPAFVEAKAQLHPQALVGDAPGVFGIIQLILRYSKTPTRATYARILRAVSDADHAFVPQCDTSL